MRNVQMIRREPGLVSIPVEKAVYCKTCETVSTSAHPWCGLCGSESILDLQSVLGGPPDLNPSPGLYPVYLVA
jgi:hypothetical protein